jgi:branched-chain amino acid transport system substrate-binding protein
MLIKAIQKAGSVDDVARIRKELLSMTYEGLWKIRYDEKGEEIINFDVVRLQRGGKISVTDIDVQ